MATCKALRKDGAPCKAPALSSGFCAFHDNGRADVFREGRIKGGKAGKLATLTEVKPWRGQPGDVDVMQSATPVELVNLLCDTIDDVRTGAIDPRVANSVGYLVGVIVKIQEVEEVESRLQAIEEALKGRL